MENVSRDLTAEGTRSGERSPHPYFRRRFIVFWIAVVSEWILAVLGLYRLGTRSSSSMALLDWLLVGGILLADYCRFQTSLAAKTYVKLIRFARNDP
jgi:hypothetical protein